MKVWSFKILKIKMNDFEVYETFEDALQTFPIDKHVL
jgi:ASC-1-like (ASCH) protein